MVRWRRKGIKEIVERNRMDWDFIESVEFQGAPREEDLIKVEDGVLKLIKMMKNKVVE